MNELVVVVEQGPDGDFTAQADSIVAKAEDMESLRIRVFEAVRKKYLHHSPSVIRFTSHRAARRTRVGVAA